MRRPVHKEVRPLFPDWHSPASVPDMCNLYSLTTNQEAIRRLARVKVTMGISG